MKTLIIIFSFLTTFLYATIINIPADQPTIQEGINVAVDSDTVLVQPGIYFENINYNGKNITVASLFFTTQDTTYISNTIIDGGQPSNPDCASVITFESGEDANAILTGFSLINGSGNYRDIHGYGHYYYFGGGIFCNGVSPGLYSLIIENNYSENSGGGFFCYESSPYIENSSIINNSANYGAGIYSDDDCNLTITNSIISGNSTSGQYGSGGGIRSTDDSSVTLQNVQITDNIATRDGGGICSYMSDYYLENVNISNNSAEDEGGGILCYDSSFIFDAVNRCNIYLNEAHWGNDIYSHCSMTVIVDTFTVLNPRAYHTFPIDNFTFDIQNCIYQQVNSDLYVSPAGNNSNSGLSWSEPLKNINFAMSIIYADSLEPHTVYLAEGTYSQDSNGENFPVFINSYITLQGENETSTILDGSSTFSDNIIFIGSIESCAISDLTVMNANTWDNGGGFHIEYSTVDIINTSSIDNDATTGAGIYCIYSEVNLNNVTVTGNTAKFVAGIDCGNSTLNIIDSNISNNLSSEEAGGISLNNSEVYIGQSIVSGNWGNGLFIGECDPILEDVTISSNTDYRGAGMYCNSSNPVLRNVTIRNNISSSMGGGLYLAENSNPIFDADSRSNIYMNSALSGRDIYTENPITVIVDTFTVLIPTSLYAFPIQEITFDILHGYIPQVNADLFVSPDGDDSNSGLSWNEPLRTINCAFSRILADSLDPHTIFLSEGTFSSATNGEVFPIVCVDHVSIEGEGIDETIIDIYDASYSSGLYLDYIQDCTLSNFTIKSNDYTAIRCLNNSCPILADLRICDSYVGIICENNSAPYFSHVLVDGNFDVGIYCKYNSNPVITNSSIINNGLSYHDAGIVCYQESNPVLVNSILWDNCNEIFFKTQGDNNSVTISYSDVQDGEAGIVTNNNGTVNWLEGNIDADPLFVDPQNGDYQLIEDSPCIDAGTAFFEWQGNILLNLTPDEYFGIAPDMGAYEWEGVNNDNQQIIPFINKLYGNYPNPFNPETTISFSVAQTSSFVTLDIFNIKGQKVKTLVSKALPAGKHSVMWDGKNEKSKNVSSGVYFYKLVSEGNFGDYISSKKMLFLK